ncbi:MAG: UDP-GlcNAc:undecaprenyl-phosphate/decaprenyl-phosphate GlcNAc-phosphate transferase [Acidimicrobiaceae bacterium]|jgi:UDP-GlcNAc:undecaprenyl-phosphate GlcNAc-1-phosphate transferase|nr:UDP-GlcNAc:undecaprenyl-phosphate/decaprenyl-phosphate GlcNAc-phosphate transferase [Acidimicrobiaceae bacterium]
MVLGGYGIVFAVAAVATWACTFVVRRLAVRIGAVVMPDERRVHAAPTPTLGGAAMFVAFLLAMLLASRLSQFKEVFASSSAPLGVVLAGTITFAVFLVDDLREMSAPAKLAGQVLAGSILALLGVTMFFFQIPFAGFVALSPDLEPLATVVWVVGMANAVNLIDGLDGLAAGIVALAGASFFIYGDQLVRAGSLGPENIGPLVAVIACGMCIGFLPHNFHPARIFMGDSGAMLLGVLMAASTLVVVGQTDNEFSGKTFFFFAPIFIPFFILGVPILDTAFAIIRRAGGRSGVAEADKEHLHHRLMRLGHGQRRSVVILWAWTALLCGMVLYPTFTKRGNAVIPVLVAALGIALYMLFHPGIRQRPVVGDPDADTEMADAGLADVVALEDRKGSAGSA